MKKKVSLISKNRIQAKEEWRAKQDALQKGIIPNEYKEVMNRGIKKAPPKVMYSTVKKTEEKENFKPKIKQMKTTAI
jgi:hypothetical protein